MPPNSSYNLHPHAKTYLEELSRMNGMSATDTLNLMLVTFQELGKRGVARDMEVPSTDPGYKSTLLVLPFDLSQVSASDANGLSNDQ